MREIIMLTRKDNSTKALYKINMISSIGCGENNDVNSAILYFYKTESGTTTVPAMESVREIYNIIYEKE